MNKCEHNEKITLFCASECCVWRNAGGCETCMKKYHNHIGQKLFLNEQQVKKIVHQYSIDHKIKPKCRQLQQVIFNYFTSIKNQITNSLNTVCKNIINQMGYPYLYQHGNLYTFKRLRNKQYKKLNSKEFRNLYEASINIDSAQLAKQQAQIYQQKTLQTIQFITKFDDLIRQFETILKSRSTEFTHDVTILDKLSKLVQDIKGPGKEYKNPIGDKINKKENITVVSGAKDKGVNKMSVSLDKKIKVKQVNISGSKPIEAVQQNNIMVKQTQIKQKKQELIHIMEQKQEKQSQKHLHKPNANNLKLEIITSVKSGISLKADDAEASFEKSINSSNKGGLNNRYALTNLPMDNTQSKIQYDEDNHQDEVKKKVFIVPLKYSDMDCDSPLMKKKKYSDKVCNKDNVILKTKKITDYSIKQKEKHINNTKTEDQISGEEQKSLALLMHSITLKSKEAIPYLQSALIYAANNLSAAQYLSFLYLQVGNAKSCLTVCNSILEIMESIHMSDQEAFNISNNKAVALNMLGRYSQSIGILEKMLRVKTTEKLYKNLGDAYQSIGINEKAIYNYEKAIKMCDTYDEAYYNMAVCLYSQGNLHNAELFIDKALQQAPKHPEYNLLHSHIVGRMRSSTF